MTKAEEIALLQKLVAQLGENSYTGPWLKEQLPFIERSIMNDFFPDVDALSIHRAVAYVRQLKEETRQECDRHIQSVQDNCRNTIELTIKQKQTADNKLRVIEEAIRTFRNEIGGI